MFGFMMLISNSIENTPSEYPVLHLIKVFILATIVISIIGYLDYKTGEISLDVLYLLILGLTIWYSSTLIGVICTIEILSAKTTAEYFDNIKIVL